MGVTTPLRRRAVSATAMTAAAITAAGITMVAASGASAEPTSPLGLESETFTEESAYLDEFDGGYYIVEFEAEPTVTYEGDLSGFAATAVEEGERYDPDSAAAKAYRDYLAHEREEILSDFDDAAVNMVYDSVFNGVAMHLSADEAENLNDHPKVKGIFEDRNLELDTVSTGEFVGVDGAGGSWEREFGGADNAGEGVIVGIIDTGFDPSNPSLAPLPEPRPDQDIIDAKWRGTCDEGDEEDPALNVTCNNKVIGAQWFDSHGLAAFGYASPLEEVNHGTHVATTAVGNHDVEAISEGRSYGNASGMAPAARLSVYKVCWSLFGTCAEANSVAAIEAAVNDGVDVLNFSISGSTSSIVTPVAQAYLRAAAAGVFVSASAGNSGMAGPSTVAHNYPWVTTVAASTHSQKLRSDFVLGDGQVFESAAFQSAELEFPLVSAVDVARDDADPAAARTCATGTIDPAKVDGEAILCERDDARLGSSLAEVRNAGAGAFIFANTEEHPANQLYLVRNEFPIINIGLEAGEAARVYAASVGEDAAVTIGATERRDQVAPEMAWFSSYGPAVAGGGDLLKPDITAPGVEVMAGFPENLTGTQYGPMSGTSMSAPHIAGLAALIASANPDWSPAMIKSAMMTTAYTDDSAGEAIVTAHGDEATPLHYGAGHVDGSRMFNPGLVYDADFIDWTSYGCGLGQFESVPELALMCEFVDPIEPSQLNYPSVSVGSLEGSYTVTRTVTNVDDFTGVYFAHVEAPAGIDVRVSKRTLVVRPGQTASFDVTFTHAGAPSGEYSFGAITWIDSRGHQVRSPLVVQPVAG
ncbi:S8 family serine peptidase [Natronoglycomyces albus]|uniref:S8 family serine peptidase n=1 Tax=Natronoglycomyces albus TaxID=2811108 RepID=A0A895XJD4_9ACTN|nr:S8 family serine peptidase [Natronoglycomyces albus]QSB05107.1 S8 family serine peptidase [Natronoglycomyces albus]